MLRGANNRPRQPERMPVAALAAAGLHWDGWNAAMPRSTLLTRITETGVNTRHRVRLTSIGHRLPTPTETA
jgi:hypothetical protein